ncbi:MAG: glycosyltransferase family 1 protein [Patescibacteria group bacterium]
MNKVFVYDPTASDKLSSVRGIGRYLQILKENFTNEFQFVSDLGSVTTNPYSIFINPFFNFLQKPLTLRRIARKQIAVIHDLIPLKYPSHFPAGIKGSIYILLNKLALKNYDLIITDSEASKLDIINILKIKSEKLRVVYPCLPKVFGMKHPVSSMKNTKYCLYVGDATWNKNLVNLARAIKIANVTCVFVGKVFQTSAVEERSGKTAEVNNGWQKEFKNFVNETKDDKRFIFAGFVPDSELIKLYQQASFNILSSRDEGFGFSYLEAANFGCPSLLSNIPVLREISAGNALYIDPKEPEKMAEKIIEINSDKIGRKKIADSAKKRSEYFSAEKFRKEFLSAIK